MDRERLLRISQRVAFTISGIALVAAGLGNIDTSSGSNDSEQLIRVPCTSSMPWGSSINKSNNGQAGEIVLASVRQPKPTPDRNRPECWEIIKDGGVIFPQPSEQ